MAVIHHLPGWNEGSSRWSVPEDQVGSPLLNQTQGAGTPQRLGDLLAGLIRAGLAVGVETAVCIPANAASRVAAARFQVRA
jgi:hypothetical protein